eukprot:PhM_4_TR7587/c0_g1_i1/m.68702/K06965/PELO, DOM34, pelA; protein pelota
MKLISKDIEKDGNGRVTLLPTEAEDLWHLYNIIREGNTIRCKTIRKVQKETTGGTAGASERKVLNLTLRVTKVDYDPVGGYMRLSGTNMTENDYVPLGAHHTSEVELNTQLSIGKGFWDRIDLDTIDEACDESLRADLCAIAMQEGLATFCLVTSSMCVVKARIEVSIPKKRRGGAAQHDKAVHRFFEHVIDAIQKNVRWDIVKAVLVGSPGLLKDDFLEYMNLYANQKDIRELLTNKSKFVPCTVSCGFKHALQEAFADRDLMKRLSDTKAAAESRALDEFYQMMNEDPDRVTYGPRHIMSAAEKGAIDTLMISDALFLVMSKTRGKWIDLMDVVEGTGGTVLKFSSLHVTGEQLNKMTGVAATLRFPCPELDDIEENLKALEGPGGGSGSGSSSGAPAAPTTTA